jgi:hypothetical protein
MKHVYLIFAFCLLYISTFAAKPITITCTPAQATIYRIEADNKETALGNGTAVLKIDRDETIKIVVRLDGYKPVFKTYIFSKTIDPPKEDKLALEDRLVKVTAQPYDAQIFINGINQNVNAGMVEVRKDATVTVEVRKLGFSTKSRVYHNRASEEVPPINETLTLTDRTVSLKAVPNDVQIIANGKKIGDGNADLIIPAGSCMTVEFVKDGFVTVEKQYCFKEGQTAPPITENIALRDRQVAIRATPEDAQIKIDGRVMGSGEYKLRIPYNSCIEVIVEKAGFVVSRKNYCNRDGVEPPPPSEHYALAVDEAFTSSVQSDQANVNFTIETSRLEEDAWKILSQITMTYFDNIELADKETGYMRTAWNSKNFLNNTIRTRIIVKQADIAPLKYTVKLVSESSGKPKISVKDDESFQPWDRILNTYKDVISEFQSRLK